MGFMLFIFALIAIYSLAPLIGFLLAYMGVYDYPFYDVTLDDLVNRLLFLIFFWLALMVSYLKARPRLQELYIDNLSILNARNKLYRLLLPLFACVLFVFLQTGYEFLVRGASSGELRTSHGLLGPFYRLSIGFIIPTLSAVIAWFYFTQPVKNINLRLSVALYVLLILIATLSTGYKASVVYLAGPFAATYLMLKGGLFRFSLFSLLLSFVLLALTMIVRDVSGLEAFHFLVHRIFYMTAYGDAGFLSVRDNIGLSPDYFLVNFLGGHISRLLFDADEMHRLIDANLSVSVSLLVYPETDRVLSGETNVTVTNFSDSLYLLNDFFLVYPLFFGCYVGVLIGMVKRFFYSGEWMRFSLAMTYIFSVILPWLNSGSFVNLFSVFTISYLVLTYIYVKIFSKIRYGLKFGRRPAPCEALTG